MILPLKRAAVTPITPATLLHRHARLSPDEPTPSPQIEMTMPPFEDGPMSQELDPPAGVEVLKKARRYLNSV